MFMKNHNTKAGKKATACSYCKVVKKKERLFLLWFPPSSKTVHCLLFAVELMEALQAVNPIPQKHFANASVFHHRNENSSFTKVSFIFYMDSNEFYLQNANGFSKNV